MDSRPGYHRSYRIQDLPAYEITISYNKDGKKVDIANLGDGTATIYIPYSYSEDEAVNYYTAYI